MHDSSKPGNGPVSTVDTKEAEAIEFELAQKCHICAGAKLLDGRRCYGCSGSGLYRDSKFIDYKAAHARYEEALKRRRGR